MDIAQIPRVGRVVSVAQMREADRRCIEVLGIPGAVLMYNAGAAVAARIAAGPVGVICGKGNNGGDGFVIAHLCRSRGMEVRLFLACPLTALTGDAALYARVYTRMGGEVTEVATPEDVPDVRRALDGCAVIVDALLGTGVQGEVTGMRRALIKAMPARHTIAVDLPSGLDGDTGLPCGIAVKANETVTFQFIKQGLMNPATAPYVGDLHVVDIGIPDLCADEAAWIARALNPEWNAP